MRKYNSIHWVALGLLCATAVQASINPGWNRTEDGAVSADWYDWTQFNTGSIYGPDSYTAIHPDGLAINPASAVNGTADVLGKSNTFKTGESGADGITVESNWDFSLWLSTYSGMEVQDVHLQITYWDDIGDTSWRQGWDLGIQTYGGNNSSLLGGIQKVGEEHDIANGWITEAYAFTIQNSADGVFVDFNANPALSVVNMAQIYEIKVDSLSYNVVPEPATCGVFVLGGVLLLRVRRKWMR